jgi:hypothetical protein
MDGTKVRRAEVKSGARVLDGKFHGDAANSSAPSFALVSPKTEDSGYRHGADIALGPPPNKSSDLWQASADHRCANRSIHLAADPWFDHRLIVDVGRACGGRQFFPLPGSRLDWRHQCRRSRTHFFSLILPSVWILFQPSSNSKCIGSAPPNPHVALARSRCAPSLRRTPSTVRRQRRRARPLRPSACAAPRRYQLWAYQRRPPVGVGVDRHRAALRVPGRAPPDVADKACRSVHRSSVAPTGTRGNSSWSTLRTWVPARRGRHPAFGRTAGP